ncbi:MAG: RecQ family ATP-dependent DNA helicase [Acidobacteria bacterium]|nr:MAG: RecQ family ATP-dependent DNA helicase [Acidobacteriota bacterium]
MDHLKILRERFGFAEFRPGQREVIQALCEHGAAVAVFPTGAGKSLCYELPALMWDGVTLVVSPLIALMKNQIDFLRSRGIAAARMDSSLTPEEARDASEQLRSGELKLLYVAPERFNNERFLEIMRRRKIALFAIDEAHCISEWGHNFRPDYLKLAETAKELKAERVLALTATATPQVVENICAGFRIPKNCAIVTGFYRPNLTIYTTPVAANRRDALLLDRLNSREPGSTIIYVTLQKTAERVASMLERAGHPARPYHAGMENQERSRVQDWWTDSDRNIVAATIAFGMGIDKAAVRYVYHYNLPKSLESYSQEIGRAGRDGAASIVELFACAEDIPTLENFAYGDTPTEQGLRGLIAHLMSQPEEFDVSLYELSVRYDIRQLVLRTALTYLELLGFLRQRTPLYASYKIKPKMPAHEIAGKFQGERARFISDVFDQAHEGRTWFTLDIGKAAENLKQDRSRLVRALEYLEEQDCVELDVAELRHQFSFVRRPSSMEDVILALGKRFQRREDQEIRRVSQVVELVSQDGCQTNALVQYFGEYREEPCGHCTWCQVREPQRLPANNVPPPLPSGLEIESFRSLQKSHFEVLGQPRQAARFLCGLNSPALTKAKLTRHALFGAFEDRRFADVLAWCEKG